MKLYKAKAIADVLMEVEGLHVSQSSVSAKQPYQMSFNEFKSVYAMYALGLSEFNTRLDNRFRKITWRALLWQSYIQTLNEAMSQFKDIPLQLISEHQSLLDRKMLIKYLKSLGLDRGKLSRMSNAQRDSFVSIKNKIGDHN